MGMVRLLQRGRSLRRMCLPLRSGVVCPHASLHEGSLVKMKISVIEICWRHLHSRANHARQNTLCQRVTILFAVEEQEVEVLLVFKAWG